MLVERTVMSPITAAMLYDLVACPHRVTMDQFGDPTERDQTSPFAELLWERGTAFEHETMAGLTQPYLDLSRYAGDEKERQTLDAMRRGEALIYSARIRADDLLGDPDLLRKDGDGYVAGDIKSGSGEEGAEDEAKLKLHYAVQLALYTAVLERKGLSAGRRPFVWDIHEREVLYDLDAPQGSRNSTTLWQEYQDCLADAQQIVIRTVETLPAYSSGCKVCHWYSACQKRLVSLDDLTLLPMLGRSKRNTLRSQIPTIKALAEIDPAGFIRGTKTIFPGIGAHTLTKLHERAKLAKSRNPQPYLRHPVALPQSNLEVFFDIEVDPMRDFTYLHGFIERTAGDNRSEQYVGVFAEEVSGQAQRDAFAQAYGYLRDRPGAVIYYYSKYERTMWRRLQQAYPDVCSENELEGLFVPPRSVDLY